MMDTILVWDDIYEVYNSEDDITKAFCSHALAMAYSSQHNRMNPVTDPHGKVNSTGTRQDLEQMYKLSLFTRTFPPPVVATDRRGRLHERWGCGDFPPSLNFTLFDFPKPRLEPHALHILYSYIPYIYISTVRYRSRPAEIHIMPKILITGGAGFIGQLLTERLLSDPKYQLILTDIIKPPIPARAKYPGNAKAIQADLSEASSLQSLISSTFPLDATYIFHGIMSSGSEANFDLGMKVNLLATMSLLEGIRKAPQQGGKLVRVIYASSQAVYGQPLPAVIDESVMPTPEGSYGAQKLIVETLVNDYTRKGFIDGLSLRFPTISIRPGKPTQAASSFLSGMIREPLNGQKCVIPLKDRSFRSWLCSPKTLAENLVYALGIDAAGKLESHKRVVNMPGIGVSVQDMMDSLAAVAGKEKLDLLKEETDADMERMLRSWGTEFDNTLAYGLGFKKDVSFEQAVRDYVTTLNG
jgi:nucleoside-diphosphate-sugar epimerase